MTEFMQPEDHSSSNSSEFAEYNSIVYLGCSSTGYAIVDFGNHISLDKDFGSIGCFG